MAVKRYNGSSWDNVAGLGAQGATGPAGASATTIVTTKGDLLTYDTTAARIGVGANNTVLTADSSTATGLKWATPAAPSFSGVSLNGNNPSIAAATRTVLAWNTETFDTDGYHDNATNNSRITIPSGKAGKYYVSHGGYWNSGTTRTIIRILKNGSAQRDMQWFGNGSSEFGSIIFAYMDLAVGDYIEIDVYNTSGTLTYWTSGTCGFNAIYLGA